MADFEDEDELLRGGGVTLPDARVSRVAHLHRLSQPLLDRARQFSFLHLVSQLERLLGRGARLGGEGPPHEEGIRFRHDPELAFSSSDVSGIELTALPVAPERSGQEPEPVFEVTTTFLGLTGPISPLPSYLAEEVAQEDADAPVRRDFLDVFHHRWISLLYRAVVHLSPSLDHAVGKPERWMQRALYLTSLDPEIVAPAESRGPSKAVLIRLAPLLAGRARGPRVLALALRETLTDKLGPKATIRIREFVGDWFELDDAARSALGVHNRTLGADLILGKRVYDQTGRFAIRIGPLYDASYRRLQPEGDLLPLLQRVVQLCVKQPLDYDLELELAPEAVPVFALRAGDRARELGRDTRLHSSSPRARIITVHDAGEVAGS